MARRGYIDHEKRAIYFWSQKCACTSLFRTLENTYGAGSNAYFNRISEPFPTCQKIITTQGYRSCVIVRNPYERAISCYLNKFVLYKGKALGTFEDLEGFSQKFYMQMQKRFGVSSTRNLMTFERFLETITDLLFERDNPNWNAIDGHWDTQIPPAARHHIYDHIIHVEAFATEFADFCSTFDLKRVEQIPNATPYANSESGYLGTVPAVDLVGRPLSQHNFRSAKADALIQSIYAIDFEKFDYAP